MAAYAALLVRTCRLRHPITQQQGVLTVWHEANLAALVAAVKGRPGLRHASFSTSGFRGVVITTLLESFGIRVVPLPPESDRAAARSLTLSIATLGREGYSVAVTADGPFGPPRVAKPGALMIAREAGIPVLPLSPGARPALRMERRWDRHIVPLPFGTISLLHGEPIEVPPRAPIRQPQLAALTAELNRLADETERWMRRRT